MTDRRDWAEMHEREWEAALATLREAYLAAQPGLRLMLSLAAQHQSSCQHPGSNPDG